VTDNDYQMHLKDFSAQIWTSQMADEEKVGKPWRDDELDAIIADYFAMLAADLAGRPYIKSRHSAALMAQIGRTHRSVEFKHQKYLSCARRTGASMDSRLHAKEELSERDL
jgi:hypothetical protein